MQKPYRILFAGNPEFAKIILNSLYQNQGNFKIEAVLTNPDRQSGRGLQFNYSPVKQFALTHNLKILQPPKLSDPSLQQKLLELADIFVVCAYGQIIPAKLFNFQIPAINVHASILPRWRGAAPIERAILAGDKTTGVSIMKIAQGLDQGDVFLSKSININNSDHAYDLSLKLAKLGGEALIEVLTDLITPKPKKKIHLISQTHLAKHNPIIYASKLLPIEGEVSFSQSATNIHNKTRAFSHLFGAYFYSQTKHKIIIRASQLIENMPSTKQFKVGCICAIDPDGITIKCGQGAIKIITIQIAGKKAMNATDAINGLRLSIGDQL